MKLEEAINKLKETQDSYLKDELDEAIETVIGELFAMQNLLDEKNEEIEHLQKENEELQKENGKLKRARKWFIEHTIGQIATPEMLDKILEDKYISKDKLIETIDFGVQATNTNDEYSVGMCNGMLYIKSVILDKDIEYKKHQNNEEKNTYEYGLVVGTKRERDYWQDKIREKIKRLEEEEKAELSELEKRKRLVLPTDTPYLFASAEYSWKKEVLNNLLKEE